MTDPRRVASTDTWPLQTVVEHPAHLRSQNAQVPSEFAVAAAICTRIPGRSVAAIFQRAVNEPEAPYHHDAESQVHENIHHGSPPASMMFPHGADPKSTCPAKRT